MCVLKADVPIVIYRVLPSVYTLESGRCGCIYCLQTINLVLLDSHTVPFIDPAYVRKFSVLIHRTFRVKVRRTDTRHNEHHA